MKVSGGDRGAMFPDLFYENLRLDEKIHSGTLSSSFKPPCVDM